VHGCILALRERLAVPLVHKPGDLEGHNELSK